MMAEPIILSPESSLRGSRDYFHSTDIYEEIAAGAKSAGLPFEGPINLRIRAKITRRPRYIFVTDERQLGNQSLKSALATCEFEAGSKCTVLVTEGNEPIISRRPYDESPAARNSITSGMRVTLTGPTRLRPIEAVTALAVHLHKTALPPPIGQRWMLGQLAINRPLLPSDAEYLEIDIDKVMSSTMTRSRITGKDGFLGTMLFILSKDK